MGLEDEHSPLLLISFKLLLVEVVGLSICRNAPNLRTAKGFRLYTRPEKHERRETLCFTDCFLVSSLASLEQRGTVRGVYWG